MRTAKKDNVYNRFSKDNIPALKVSDNETFMVETQLNGGTWLNSIDDLWDPSKSRGPNLCTVIEIEGAMPGDTLAVEIIDVKPGKLGYTGFAGWRNKLSQLIYPNDWDVVTKTVRITDEYVDWSDELKLPLKPMIGTIATAPENGEQSTQYAYENGGNMDVQEVTNGTTIYLPINVEGALLHVGDCHAIMGDGEIPHGGAIECQALLTLRVRLIKGYKAHKWIRMENDEYIMTIANNIRIKDSFAEGVHELIDWMVDDYGFTPQEAYLLLGQVLEARCTMLHGDDEPFSPYVCKIRKEYLKAQKDPIWKKDSQ
ncbi:MAG: acetamidase/formamidase family protein [Erysipelotrichaceae bacterium]|nr:acetamidase/formamidase family protein [Erysipelotrichaceae bacterium]